MILMMMIIIIAIIIVIMIMMIKTIIIAVVIINTPFQPRDFFTESTTVLKICHLSKKANFDASAFHGDSFQQIFWKRVDYWALLSSLKVQTLTLPQVCLEKVFVSLDYNKWNFLKLILTKFILWIVILSTIVFSSHTNFLTHFNFPQLKLG